MQETNLCAQARRGKEDREKQDGTDVLQAYAKLGPKITFRGHDQAGNKCSKERVNTEQLGAERGGQNDRHDNREQAPGWLGPFDRLLSKPAGNVRLDDKEHYGGKN